MSQASLPAVGASIKGFPTMKPSERAKHAAKVRDERNKALGSPKVPHPATADILYNAHEWEFMRSMEEFKARTGRKFPTWRDVYSVFVALGYAKPRPEPAADEPGPLESEAEFRERWLGPFPS